MGLLAEFLEVKYFRKLDPLEESEGRRDWSSRKSASCVSRWAGWPCGSWLSLWSAVVSGGGAADPGWTCTCSGSSWLSTGLEWFQLGQMSSSPCGLSSLGR